MLTVCAETVIPNPHMAFQALTSKEDAVHFRDIKEYLTYHREGSMIRVTFRSGVPKGKVLQTMNITSPSVIEFMGRCHGVRWDGQWTIDGEKISLVQRVHGPMVWVARGFVERAVKVRIERVLQDVQSLSGLVV